MRSAGQALRDRTCPVQPRRRMPRPLPHRQPARRTAPLWCRAPGACETSGRDAFGQARPSPQDCRRLAVGTDGRIAARRSDRRRGAPVPRVPGVVFAREIAQAVEMGGRERMVRRDVLKARGERGCPPWPCAPTSPCAQSRTRPIAAPHQGGQPTVGRVRHVSMPRIATRGGADRGAEVRHGGAESVEHRRPLGQRRSEPRVTVLQGSCRRGRRVNLLLRAHDSRVKGQDAVIGPPDPRHQEGLYAWKISLCRRAAARAVRGGDEILRTALGPRPFVEAAPRPGQRPGKRARTDRAPRAL